jgi:hypothetical protein
VTIIEPELTNWVSIIELQLGVNLRILGKCLGSCFLFTGSLFHFFIQLILYFLLHLTWNKKTKTKTKTKTKPTNMAPRTRRTPRPKTAKAKTKTKPTPSKKAKTVKTAMTTMTAMTAMKKGGHHPDDDSLFNHLGDLCKFRASEGTIKVPRTNTGKNPPLANWVHYVRKGKALDLQYDHHMDALNGIKFQWTAG